MLVTLNLSTDPPPLRKNEGRGGLRGGGVVHRLGHTPPPSHHCPKGRTIRKVMGWGGGGGEFSSRRSVFSSSNFLYEFF